MGGAPNRSSDLPNNADSLRSERDRFVAFAFCSADILIEVDEDLRILFAAGAFASIAGKTPEDAVGTNVTALIDPIDRPLIAELVRGMRNGVRLDPVSVRFEAQHADAPKLSMSGYHLPDVSESLFFSFRIPRQVGDPADDPKAPGREEARLLDRDTFAQRANDKMVAAKNSGEQVKLTMVRVPDMPTLAGRLDKDATEALRNTIGACLRLGAAPDDIAGQFDEQNYGILHKEDLDVADMQSRIEEHIKQADPTATEVDVCASSVSAEAFNVDQATAVKALVHTINEFCEADGDSLAQGSLSDTLESLAESATTRLNELGTIIAAELFDAVFQPIVRVEDRSMHHYEALVRFGGRPDQSPFELITFAENAGLICDLDLAMCRKMLHLMEQKGAQGKRYDIAVNLSGRSIANAAFMDSAEKLFARYGSVRKQLLIEITESAQIRDLETANKAIQTLRQAGHKVCLDDFGAGATAFRYLHMLDVDIVKIDGHYIMDAIRRPKNRAFLRSIARLCHELGIETIAERVEEEETIAILAECGIGYGQGYLFGRPGADIESFV